MKSSDIQHNSGINFELTHESIPACITQFPDDRFGWPWIDAPPFIPHTLSEGTPWPKISIVTPSCNQAQFLEEAIRSVLLQGYPNLEYIVIDGGSTDGSVEIIKKYEPWLTYWVSEKDQGQAFAINKGFSKATGEITSWLSSDDIYLPGAFFYVAEIWINYKNSSTLITGSKLKGNATLEEITREEQSPYTIQHLLEKCNLEQPATFFPLELFQRVGGIDEKYFMALDYDLWLRMTRAGANLIFTGQDYAITRTHPTAKSRNFQQISIAESLKTVWNNYHVISSTWLKKYITYLIVPQKIKSDSIQKYFYIIRNVLYSFTMTVVEMLHFDRARKESIACVTIIPPEPVLLPREFTPSIQASKNAE